MYNTAQAWLGMFYANAHDRITNAARREDGQAVVEYALILGLVVVGAIFLLGVLGTDVKGKLKSVTDAL